MTETIKKVVKSARHLLPQIRDGQMTEVDANIYVNSLNEDQLADLEQLYCNYMQDVNSANEMLTKPVIKSIHY